MWIVEVTIDKEQLRSGYFFGVPRFPHGVFRGFISPSKTFKSGNISLSIYLMSKTMPFSDSTPPKMVISTLQPPLYLKHNSKIVKLNYWMKSTT